MTATAEPTSVLIVVTYLLYLTVSVALTIWVARSLFNNGGVFLIDVFQSQDLARSVNHLLVVGFYLINLGYVLLALKLTDTVVNVQGSIEALAEKLGFVLLVLGFMHFFNLLVFSRIRRAVARHDEPPPIEPDRRIDPPAAEAVLAAPSSLSANPSRS